MSYGGAWAALPAAVLFMAAACGYVLAAGRSNSRVTWYTKPFAVPLLALTYVLASPHPNLWILAGLGCGTVGDVFLIHPERRGFFMAGLAAFLFGHVAYLAAFLRPVFQAGVASAWLFAAALPLAAFGILVYCILRPGLGGMKVPVALYTAVILSMALAALLRVSSVSGLPFWLPLLGALCFIASDALLAYQQFRGPVTSGRTLVAVTYVGAQTLIVLGYLFRPLPMHVETAF
jgi:uncharacterized membrane protein YhhN